MSTCIRTWRALVVAVVISTPAVAFGQSTSRQVSSSLSSPYRPWLGVSFGRGFLGGDSVEPDDSRDIGVSLDIPLRRAIRTRVVAGRMRVNSPDFEGGFPLRRLTFDGIALVPFRGPGTSCQSNVVMEEASVSITTASTGTRR